MKIVVLSDTHGRCEWKYIVKKEYDANLFVFLGDYFDSYDLPGVVQIYNFKEIIDFKKSSKAEVVLLLGNHDCSYIPGFDGASVSGYQPGTAPNITQVIEENKHHLKMCHQSSEFIFSHAGISPVWLRDNNWDGEQDVCEYVNLLWQYRPLSFKFSGWEPYGENETQTPIWIRPKSLMKGAKEFKDKYIQVVGHTQQNQIDIKGKSTGGKYYFTDTLGTSQEYLIIEDGKVKLGKL